jgi:hypothetical protein
MTQTSNKLIPESLRVLLGKLAPIDDDLPPEQFDPAVVVGDVKDKIDAIKWQIDEWEYKAKMLDEQWIKPLQAKSAALKGKANRLNGYVKTQMEEHGFEKLPGNAFRAQLQKAAAAVKTACEPLFSHFKAYPEFVKQEVYYSWKKKAIKDAIDSSKYVRFYGQETPQISGESNE